MSILSDKYKDFKPTPLGEFPDLYSLLLYESGGDFLTYSKILGYDSFEDFKRDLNEYEEEIVRKLIAQTCVIFHDGGELNADSESKMIMQALKLAGFVVIMKYKEEA